MKVCRTIAGKQYVMIIIDPQPRNVATKSTTLKDEFEADAFSTKETTNVTTEQSQSLTMDHHNLSSSNKNISAYSKHEGIHRNESFIHEIQNAQIVLQESSLLQTFRQLSLHDLLLIVFLFIIFLLVIVLMIIGALVLKSVRTSNRRRTLPKHLTSKDISNPFSFSVESNPFHHLSRLSTSTPSSVETTSTLDELAPRVLQFCEHDSEYVEVI